ncbi:PAS domain S-box-containing protein [Paraburkholderia sp. Clong3]|uniref:hybrid sensor histidine kinase/response regulator n=1 Tax=Paraburkholderia sp. Clong3 TaxID=2991061 RepID=UPI003D1E8432
MTLISDSSKRAATNMSSARILIVEDDRVVARDIAQQMTRCGHVVIGCVTTGEDAITVAAKEKPSLVLMDVRLEGKLDGIDAARQLRESLRLPIVFLTAYADEETVRRATVTEPFGYVLKPFDDLQLRTVVEMALYKHDAERQLRESEQRYAVTLDCIGDGVIATDCKGHVTLINPVAEALTEWSREDAVGQPLEKVLRLIDEDTNAPLKFSVSAALGEGGFVSFPPKTMLVGRAGRMVSVENRGTPIVNDSGNVIGMVLVVRDATASRQAAEAEILRETNDRLDGAMRGSKVGVWAIDLAGEEGRDLSLRCWNIQAWLGYTEADAAPGIARVMEVIHPEDRQRVCDAFWRCSREPGGLFGIEHRVLHRDGSWRWVLTRGAGPRFSCGPATRVSGTMVDITDLKRAELALRTSEERFRGTFENAAVGIVHCDQSGRFLRVNRRYCDIVGYSREELLSMTFMEVTAVGSVPESINQFKKLLKNDFSHYTEEKVNIRRDGSRVWVSATVSLQRDSSQQVQHTIAIIQDISARKALEETVRVARDEAELANKAKDQFLANISHELRTPLNCILGYTQVLRRDDNLSVRQKSHVSLIEQSGSHLVTLINDLLDFARVGAGRIDLELNDVLLAPFLEMLGEMVGVRAREKGLAQICAAAPNLPAVIRVDEKRLRQVLLNLLSNAVKFTDIGEVAFSVKLVRGGVLRFEVKDTGIGIKHDQLERVFQPFEQAGDIERRSAGLGLGLSISQHLARLMGSDIHVESEYGRGSRFWFDLAVECPAHEPLVRDDAGDRQAPRDECLMFAGRDGVRPATEHVAERPRRIGATPSDAEAVSSFVLPPRASMEVLHDLARRGSMREVMRHVESLRASDTRYTAFATRVGNLAENFESRELLVLIEKHLNGS